MVRKKYIGAVFGTVKRINGGRLRSGSENSDKTERYDEPEGTDHHSVSCILAGSLWCSILVNLPVLAAYLRHNFGHKNVKHGEERDKSRRFKPALPARPGFGEPKDRLVGSSLAMPERTTGARSGNSATSDRFPPMARTVFQSVDSNWSLRFSSRETLSWVIPSTFAIRTCVNFRARRNSRSVISSTISPAARASSKEKKRRKKKAVRAKKLKANGKSNT